MLRKLLITGALFLISVLIFFYKQSPTDQAHNNSVKIDRYQAELRGEFICLTVQGVTPEKGSKCDYGIKTDKNEVYAIDFNLLSQNKPDLKPGDRFSASGNVTPIEMISTDYWQKYGIMGIFSVTDSVKKL